jgi:hypothetical protein
MLKKLRYLLENITGTAKGGLSEERLEKALRQMCGRVTRLDDGHSYRLVEGRNSAGRVTFMLEQVQ